MRTALKIFFGAILLLIVLFVGFFTYAFIVTFDAKVDFNKLKSVEKSVCYYAANGEKIEENDGNNQVVSLEEIPKYTVDAFIAIEDKRFYEHNGIDFRALCRALFNNIKSFSLKEGASTISQQLIKNTHLSNEKTLKRKLIEIKLTKELEKNMSKNEIIETYLNTIYFGENCYGIVDASERYFSKKPSELSLSESAVLAGLIKAPSSYSPVKNIEKSKIRRNVVLKEMLLQNKISNEEYKIAKASEIEVSNEKDTSFYDYVYLVSKEVEKYAERSGNYYEKLNVYTFFDAKKQEVVESEVDCDGECLKSAVIYGKMNRCEAYYSTVGDVCRQMGSVIKPVGVYAPAIEKNIIFELSPILDEKADFNGYSPSNYGEKYSGYISAKDALKYSKNVCAVKVLDSLGVDESAEFLQNQGINVSDNDKALSLALGATEKGEKLTNIAASYGTFVNGGYYYSPTCIDKITDKNGNVLYSGEEFGKKVYQKDTVFILNDMLRSTVTEGTAKRLRYSNVETCAKTGTVGFDDGNTDAYTVSYNNENIVAVWYGSAENSLLNNSVTGGTLPCDCAKNIWNKIYDGVYTPFVNECDEVVNLSIDKECYDNEHIILLADSLTPKRYTISGFFKKNYTPKMTDKKCSEPKVENIETQVNQKRILIRLCLTKYAKATIYKIINGVEVKMFDTGENGDLEFIDFDVKKGEDYEYFVIPYCETTTKVVYGEKVFLPKIKVPTYSVDTDWWRIVE